jgi:hypothetical protein
MFSFYNALKRLKNIATLFVFFITVAKAQGQPPTNPDPSGNSLPIQLSPSQLYEGLKDNNPAASKSTIGQSLNTPLENKIARDSLVRENTPQSKNIT